MTGDEQKFESLEARADRFELEYQELYRKEYGSNNSTKPKYAQPTPIRFVTFYSDTNFGLLRKIALFKRVVVGSKLKQIISTRGNKRLGRTIFYCDVLNSFLDLKRLGIILPKNVLSQKACEYGLIDALREHKKIPGDLINKKSFNSREREKIRKSNESAFARIIRFL